MIPNPAIKAELDDLLLPLPGVTAGQMFGLPAYYAGGKLFACVYGDGVGVKVPAPLAQALLARNDVIPFQPMGRPKMREWVQINRAVPSDYRLDLETFEAALDFAGGPARAGC